MRELLTAGQVSEALQIKVSTLRELTRRREIPCVRIGRQIRYDAADLDEWLEGKKRQMEPS